MAFRQLTDKTRTGFDSLRSGTSAMSDFIKRVMPSNFHIKKLGPEGLIALKKELVAARPIFEEAGFDLAAVQLEMTLSPRMLAYFHITDHFDREAAEAIHKANKDSPILNTAFSALIRTASWEAAAEEQEMPMQTITIDVSLTPGVHLTFQDDPPDGEEPDLI